MLNTKTRVLQYFFEQLNTIIEKDCLPHKDYCDRIQTKVTLLTKLAKNNKEDYAGVLLLEELLLQFSLTQLAFKKDKPQNLIIKWIAKSLINEGLIKGVEPAAIEQEFSKLFNNSYEKRVNSLFIKQTSLINKLQKLSTPALYQNDAVIHNTVFTQAELEGLALITNKHVLKQRMDHSTMNNRVDYQLFIDHCIRFLLQELTNENEYPIINSLNDSPLETVACVKTNNKVVTEAEKACASSLLKEYRKKLALELTNDTRGSVIDPAVVIQLLQHSNRAEQELFVSLMTELYELNDNNELLFNQLLKRLLDNQELQRVINQLKN